jgi:predicted AAA+ superfamily ATPase
MKPLFYIGCLPRSGSAWLSSALNACTPLTVGHEVLGRYGNSWTEMYDGGVGSDIIVPCMREYVPEGVGLFYLCRSKGEILESLKKTGTFNREAWGIQKEWDSIYCDIASLHRDLYYDDLRSAVYTIADYMGVPVNETKLDEMLLMRVTSKRWHDSIEEEWSE